MADAAESWQTPYTSLPGSSTPPPETNPKEGVRDLWAFFWLSVANTLIIAVAGLAAWFWVH